MPDSYINRAFARNYNEAQIMFAANETSDFTSGVMRNYSVDGMCFISSNNMMPGELIDIQIMEHAAGSGHTGLKGRGYGAEVIWCKKMGGGQHFLTGVRFYKPSRRTILQDA